MTNLEIINEIFGKVAWPQASIDHIIKCMEMAVERECEAETSLHVNGTMKPTAWMYRTAHGTYFTECEDDWIDTDGVTYVAPLFTNIRKRKL